MNQLESTSRRQPSTDRSKTSPSPRLAPKAETSLDGITFGAQTRRLGAEAQRRLLAQSLMPSAEVRVSSNEDGSFSVHFNPKEGGENFASTSVRFSSLDSLKEAINNGAKVVPGNADILQGLKLQIPTKNGNPLELALSGGLTSVLTKVTLSDDGKSLHASTRERFTRSGPLEYSTKTLDLATGSAKDETSFMAGGVQTDGSFAEFVDGKYVEVIPPKVQAAREVKAAEQALQARPWTGNLNELFQTLSAEYQNTTNGRDLRADLLNLGKKEDGKWLVEDPAPVKAAVAELFGLPKDLPIKLHTNNNSSAIFDGDILQGQVEIGSASVWFGLDMKNDVQALDRKPINRARITSEIERRGEEAAILRQR